MRRLARCSDCGRGVLWTITEAGRRLAVDPEPDEAGNTAVYQDGAGTWRSRRPTNERPLTGWERLHTPHVASCPYRPDATAPASHRNMRPAASGRRPGVAARLPPMGRCALCGQRRHLSTHRSRRDGLPRPLCTRCFSAVTVVEDSGHAVDFSRPAAVDVDEDDDGLFPLPASDRGP